MPREIAKRYLYDPIDADLAEKMVFVSGPRQVGKTTLALHLIGAHDALHPAYLSWDDVRARPRIRRAEMPPGEPRLILDEIHKYARWRNLVKGLYDTRAPGGSFLITGSARLDVYRRGGDSLQGRYHSYRLHPLSLTEVGGGRDSLAGLLRFGGFPEPFLRGTERHWRRWQRERLDRVVRDDVRDLERVREVSLVALLIDALPSRVGPPLSVKSLREDLEVAHDTAERWLGILENLYVCFRIAPFGAPRIRAVKKEQKLYLWDWSMVEDQGARFENLVASHLLPVDTRQSEQCRSTGQWAGSQVTRFRRRNTGATCRRWSPSCAPTGRVCCPSTGVWRACPPIVARWLTWGPRGTFRSSITGDQGATWFIPRPRDTRASRSSSQSA